MVQGGGLKILYRYLCVGSNPTPVNIMVDILSIAWVSTLVSYFLLFFLLFFLLLKINCGENYIGLLLHKLLLYSLDNRICRKCGNRKPNTNIKSLFFFAVLLNPSYYELWCHFAFQQHLYSFLFLSLLFKIPGRVCCFCDCVVVVVVNCLFSSYQL